MLKYECTGKHQIPSILIACFFSLIVRTIETVAFKATHHAISMPSFSKM